MAKKTRSKGQEILPYGWCNTAEAARYVGVDSRYILAWFKRGLRHVEMSKKMKLTRYDYIDDFLNGFHPVNKTSIQDLVADVFKKVVEQDSTTTTKGAE